MFAIIPAKVVKECNSDFILSTQISAINSMVSEDKGGMDANSVIQMKFAYDHVAHFTNQQAPASIPRKPSALLVKAFESIRLKSSNEEWRYIDVALNVAMSMAVSRNDRGIPEERLAQRQMYLQTALHGLEEAIIHPSQTEVKQPRVEVTELSPDMLLIQKLDQMHVNTNTLPSEMTDTELAELEALEAELLAATDSSCDESFSSTAVLMDSRNSLSLKSEWLILVKLVMQDLESCLPSTDSLYRWLPRRQRRLESYLTS
jgi:hypothetical protein